ncbi:T9SS type A sorting domain-containing protein [Flavobacterium sp. JAS]|uniref:T9SS type A sorting domain-containing protein n=1 Tax=Flavobacterium sp. JAS TaxID=2897329 RepID=UPI001E417939|nr:T9SS type A sorting domain-containing protein [Flavobacterium sp. JAS]MCD0469152.1 T9SS type A sorting domain-containing protein [Flavobacterium sp. JAS]
MKKIILLLLLITVTISYSQTGIRKVTISNPPAFSAITANITNVTGSGLSDGTITLNAISGGTPSSPGAYNIAWTYLTNPAETVNTTQLKAGTYRVRVTDSKGCFVEKDFVVNQPDLIEVAIDEPTVISCFGGNGSLTAKAKGGFPYGGTPTYTYNWFKCDNINGDNPLAVNNTGAQLLNVKAGFYMVNVIDNQNMTKITTDIEELKQNPKIQVIEVVTPVSCREAETGSIKLTPSGGAPGTTYSIAWNDDSTIKSFERTGLTAGTYRYTITDNLVVGCSTATVAVTINQPAVDLSVTYTSIQPTLTNNNGEITLNVTGGILPGGVNSYTYAWSKVGDTSFQSQDVSQRTDLGNGTYNITVISSSGCILSPSISITLEALNIKSYTQQNIKCFGAETGSLTVEVSGGTNNLTGYHYKWFKNDIEITGEETKAITALAAGTYRVEVNDDLTTINKTYIITTEPSAPLSATHTFTDVVCFGENNGAITLNIKGGMIPYTVVWKDVLTGDTVSDPTKLKLGTYSYVITDANLCTFPSPQNIVINQKSAIAISNITQKQPTLFTTTDGEITINATGGTNNYTYILKKNNVITEYPASPITGLGEGVYEVSVKDSNNCTTAVQTITLKALAVVFVNKVDVTCNSANTGSIEVLASGGTPIIPNQYTYKWSYKEKAVDTYTVLTGKITNKIENLYAGFYKILVTDNVNISRELEIAELTERPAITYTFTKTEVNCYNGSDGTITLNIQGGTGNYHVVWNDGITTKDRTGIPMGDYSFSITDDNGCSYSSTPIPVKITQPLKPLLIASSNKVEATGYGLKNGSIDIVVSDGTFPYTYQWYQGAAKTLMTGKTNPLLNGIGTDTYTVIVTDINGCTTEATYTILQPNKLLITAINETESIKCFGYKEAVLKATITGGAPIGVLDATKNYIYRWYNELDPLVTVSTNNPTEVLLAGNYFLEVSDGFGNSFTSNKVTINEPTPVKISFTQTDVSCKNGHDGKIEITTTGGTGLHTISWSVPSGANPNVIDNLYAGNYSVTVRDENNCFDTQNFIITEPEILAIKSVVKTPPSALGVDDASIAVTVQGGTPNYNFNWLDQNKNVIFTDNNQNSNTSIYNIYAGQYFISITDAKGCTIIERDLDKVDPLFIDLVQINTVQCFDDATASIKALTSGGLPGYYYKWYNVNNPAIVVGTTETLTNAKAGTYYVVATDSFDKSIQSKNITITEPTALTNTLSSEYVRCGNLNDWTITSAVLGGTLPYTYLWNTGAKTPNLIDVIPGNYSLIVTDKNSCTITKNITVTAPAHLDAAEKIKIPTCYEGSDATIVVTPIAGTAPYKYLWNTGETTNILNNAAAGEYSVEITDARGCIILRNYTIINPPKDIINLGEDVTLCFDQTLTVNAAIDDDKATYSWTSDKGFTSNKALITVSEPANYTVVVTNKLGCKATDTIKISSQQTAISAEFAVSSQVFKNEKIIIVDISNPAPDTVEWVIPADATIVSKDKDYAEISFSKAGEYDITLNTTKGNCTASQTKTVLVTEGEYQENNPEETTKNFDLKIYPNPSSGNFTVDVTLDKVMPANVKVYSLNNNLLIDSKTDNGKSNYLFNFSLNGLPSGIYFVLFESQQGSKLRKIIIQ